MISSNVPITILSAADWRARMEQHRQRAERFTLPARKRRDFGTPHPVEDFLFRYYPYPFALLENWQPGLGIGLKIDGTASTEFATRHYSNRDGLLFADPALLTTKEQLRLQWILNLLQATQDRAPNFACHGLHEWAMVYGGKEVRHDGTAALRLPQREIDHLVESRAIRCSHHDAFRFFAKESRPLNRLQPDLESRHLLEQPGCVHANMDLYKWTAKSMPWAGSDLLMDCFELAMELRELDMCASPYDLTEWGCEPVRIETPEGRRDYEIEQRRLAAMAVPLRGRLMKILKRVC